MCNACHFQCCAADCFYGCGCDSCANPDCWVDDEDEFGSDDEGCDVMGERRGKQTRPIALDRCATAREAALEEALKNDHKSAAGLASGLSRHCAHATKLPHGLNYPTLTGSLTVAFAVPGRSWRVFLAGLAAVFRLCSQI